jgi:hypothetical protein
MTNGKSSCQAREERRCTTHYLILKKSKKLLYLHRKRSYSDFALDSLTTTGLIDGEEEFDHPAGRVV